MSIKARLTAGIAIFLVAVFAAMGVVMARSTESTLTEQVDQKVIEQSDYTTKPISPDGKPQYGPDSRGDIVGARPPDSTPIGGSSADSYDEGRRSCATIIYTSTGDIRMKQLSGYADDPDSPPALPAFGSDEFNNLIGDMTTLTSEDGSLRYRVLAAPGRIEGDVVVTAGPMDEVDEAVSQLVWRFVLIGGLGLLVAAGASWWVIRREFRPVDGMVDTAAAIAGGDLSRRVPEGSARTELGRLGGALNEMLGQIEEGIQQRERNEQRLRRFVADAAHELRTPLTSVRGYAELYRQGAYQDRDAVDHAMTRIESEGERMARLVDDLLILARMDQQRPIEQRPLDLVSLVSEAVADFETTSNNHAVEWEPEGELVIRGDRTRIRQVVDNLLGNARMHTPEGTSIRLAARRVGDEAELIVEDSGPGILVEDQERVFERFWRADTSRNRQTGGSGLGLAIVQSLVQAHGGTVRLESEPGNGARFIIRLPLARTASPASAPSETLGQAGARQEPATHPTT